MIVIGLTGSIGMGKTTVAHMMRDMGIPVHDSDAAVHAFLGPNGDAVQAVAARFPQAAATDENGAAFIDRKILGRLVFADRDRKTALEAILHPMVRARSDAFLSEMKKRAHPIVALDIPLLFETGGEKRVDASICVFAPPDVQKARVLQRSGMTAEKFDRVVAGQMPDAEKRKRADYAIENGGDLDDTRAQLKKIIDGITRKTGAPPA